MCPGECVFPHGKTFLTVQQGRTESQRVTTGDMQATSSVDHLNWKMRRNSHVLGDCIQRRSSDLKIQSSLYTLILQASMLVGSVDMWVTAQTPPWQQDIHIYIYIYSLVPHSSDTLPCVHWSLWSPCYSCPMERLICRLPEACSRLHSKTGDSFKPSCWTMMKCTSAKTSSSYSCLHAWLWDLSSPLQSFWPLKLIQVNVHRLQSHHWAGGWGAMCQIQTPK